MILGEVIYLEIIIITCFYHHTVFETGR